VFSYDPTLLAAVETAPATIPGVLQTLETIESICIDGDGLKWFNGLYLQVTQAVAARVAAGGFADPAWMAQLDVRFAGFYFAALRSSLSGQPAPSCWQVMLSSRGQSAIARIQFALAGVNAHINRDLPDAIVATCQATGTTPDAGGTHYNDYTALNSTLDGLIESAKRVLHVRLLGEALPPVSHLEDTLAAWSVTASRKSAWTNAGHLWQFRLSPVLAAGFMDMLDGFTAVIGKTLLVPVPLADARPGS